MSTSLEAINESIKLVREGAPFDMPDKDGNTLVEIAKKHGVKSAEIFFKELTRLYEGIYERDRDKISESLTLICHLFGPINFDKIRNRANVSPLHMAAVTAHYVGHDFYGLMMDLLNQNIEPAKGRGIEERLREIRASGVDCVATPLSTITKANLYSRPQLLPNAAKIVALTAERKDQKESDEIRKIRGNLEAQDKPTLRDIDHAPLGGIIQVLIAQDMFLGKPDLTVRYAGKTLFDMAVKGERHLVIMLFKDAVKQDLEKTLGEFVFRYAEVSDIDEMWLIMGLKQRGNKSDPDIEGEVKRLRTLAAARRAADTIARGVTAVGNAASATAPPLIMSSALASTPIRAAVSAEGVVAPLAGGLVAVADSSNSPADTIELSRARG